MNNVLLATLFIVVNNTERVIEPESSPQSGVAMLNNIVDNIKQYGQHNIVQSCFQQMYEAKNRQPVAMLLRTRLVKTMLCCPHCLRLLTTLNSIVTPDSGSTILFNVVDKYCY